MNFTPNPIIDRAQQEDFPEIINDYLEHGVIKCVTFNRRGTLLAAAGNKDKEVDYDEDEDSKKPFKSDSPPYRKDNNDDDGSDDGAPPSTGVSITQVDTTSTLEDFAIIAFESRTQTPVEGPTVQNAAVTSTHIVKRNNMGINHGFTIMWLNSRI